MKMNMFLLFHAAVALLVSNIAEVESDIRDMDPETLQNLMKTFLGDSGGTSDKFASPLHLLFQILSKNSVKEIATRIEKLGPPDMMPAFRDISNRMTLDLFYDMFITNSVNGFFDMLQQVVEESFPDHHYKDNIQNVLKRLKPKITPAVFVMILKCGSLKYFFDPWTEAAREEYDSSPSTGIDFLTYIDGFRKAFDYTTIFKLLKIDEKDRCVGNETLK